MFKTSFLFALLCQCIYLQCVAALNFIAADKYNTTLQVKVHNGLIQGFEAKTLYGKAYFRYQAVPYAQPPVNELRFRSPLPVSNWSGVVDATTTTPCCASIDIHKISDGQFRPVGVEDCLHLNVYTPVIKKQETKLPVLVYVYGGGFFSGCSKSYGPDFIIEHDVILVVPNYRLSLFGYLSTEDQNCPGNWAIKDLILSLKWVQLNIEQFGGDPQKVTIWGLSAGAANVNALLLAPQAKDLFHGAIQNSGTVIAFWAYQTNSRKVAFDLGLHLGIETNSTKILMRELRNMDSVSLLEAQGPVFLVNVARALTDGLPFATSMEYNHNEAVLTGYPYQLIEKGRFHKVPLMIGVASAEVNIFQKLFKWLRIALILFDLSPGSYTRFTKNFSNRRKAALEIFQHFLSTTSMSAAKLENIKALFSSDTYVRPSQKVAKLMSKYSPVYFYEFTYEGDAGLQQIQKYSGPLYERDSMYRGTVHTEEVVYQFMMSFMNETRYNKDDLMVANKLTKLITNFAKTCNPTPTVDPILDNVTWPRISNESIPYLDIGQKLTVHLETYDEKNLQFWEDLYRRYGAKPYKVY